MMYKHTCILLNIRVCLLEFCITGAPNKSFLRSHDGLDAPLESSCLCRQQTARQLTSFCNKARHIANQCFDKNEH